MPNHHHISPVCPDIAGQNDKSVRDGMHGIPQGLSLSGIHDPIFPKVTIRTESPGLAETVAIGRGYRQVKSIRCDGSRFRGWE